VPRRLQSPAKQAPDASEPPKRQAAAILARRRLLMLQIAVLRRSGQGSNFTDNAEQLLTRWWSKASWTARGELLKTVEWLLHVENRRSDTGPLLA
jgi:hypothetical protein